MRALVVEQDAGEKPMLVGAALAGQGFDLASFVVQPDVQVPEAEVTFPEPDGYDLLVVMGSPWSVYDHRVAAWVDPELKFLASAVEAQVPVLGICFGGQALSAALGGSVGPADRREYGWLSFESEVPALAGPWFTLHDDAFTVPPGGVELARSPVCSQAFRFGRSLGVQFHPEIDAAHLESWFASGDLARKAEAEGLDPRRLVDETRRREPEMRVRTAALVDWFLRDVARL